MSKTDFVLNSVLAKYRWSKTRCNEVRRDVTAESIHGWLEFRPTPYHGWLEFQQVDTSYRWLHPTADSSSGGWIRLKADFILRLTSCGWFYSAADLSPAAGVGLRLIYTLIYQVILRNYSAKCIIFIVFVLPTDFSYHWSRLWLLFQELWRSLRKLKQAWRSFKTLAATDSSCSGWFELRRLIRDLRPIDYLQNFDSDAPW